MIRYRLDDLGWYQFEWLIQAALKDRLGIGIESWGGHSDHGRDAWCGGPLNFPANQSNTTGPFLFQVKFIENANAVGSRPLPRLVAAVKAEMAKVTACPSRGQNARSNCKHYILLTNAVVSPAGRREVELQIQQALPRVIAHCLAGNDVCDLLDGNVALRRSFPQLLSLRDLDVLLAQVVNRDIVARSSAAISHARDIVSVFVPTGAYLQTWDVLKRNSFAVLEGPPEMGKSSIAWMIALTQIALGWEANVCDSPDDFFRALRADLQQIFIADDAFGRTEYDPARGAKWEAQLHRVFTRLGDSHWLIWTSRKHILERARVRMDLQGVASAFPQPGQVVVDASRLTIREKSLILYRHSKHSLAESNSTGLIRCHAVQIVSNDAFTPERIRRFVVDVVPQLALDVKSQTSPKELVSTIGREIQNPTDRMRKCFKALSLAHKWMLLSLLESEHYCTTDELVARYRSQYADGDVAPKDILEELTEAFIRIKDPIQPYVEWIHPSYRDLVIEQLRDGGELKSEFLNRMNVAGIKLALSGAGGASGKLRFPLVTSAGDWETVEKRCFQVARDSYLADGTDLLTILSDALEICPGKERATVQRVLTATCRILRERWDTGQVELKASTIDAYAKASEHTSPMEPMPALDVSWYAVVRRLQSQLNDYDFDFLFETESLDGFLFLVEAIQKAEPRFLRRVNFPVTVEAEFQAVLNRVDRELVAERSYSGSEGYESEADASLSLVASLKHLITLSPEFRSSAESRVNKLTIHANVCRERYKEAENEESEEVRPFEDEEYRHSSGLSFSIDSVFTDL